MRSVDEGGSDLLKAPGTVFASRARIVCSPKRPRVQSRRARATFT